MTRIEELQDRIDDRSQRDPAAMLAWEELIRSWDERVRAGAVADTPREWPRALRLGELRYERTTPPNGELRVPATFGHDVDVRHVLISRAPAEADRAAALLNSVALRYALGTDSATRHLLLVDEYVNGRNLSTVLTDPAMRIAKEFRPSSLKGWMDSREQQGQPALALVHATHRLGDPVDIDEVNVFTDRELADLLEHMRSPYRSHVIVALAFDPREEDHPVRRAWEDARFPALRVRLAPGDDEVRGTGRERLVVSFHPDECPASDIARRLLRPVHD